MIPDRDAESGSRGTSRGGVDSGASPSTPATSTHPLDDEDEDGLDQERDAWNGWSAEDKAAVEEAERFDDISVVGFWDEEQEKESKWGKPGSVVAEKQNIKKKGRGRGRGI